MGERSTPTTPSLARDAMGAGSAPASIDAPEGDEHAADDALGHALVHARELLPAQGPLSVFVHHNILHAFEDRPFEDAVVEAAGVLDAEPYWPEDAYRACFAGGRVRDDDLRHAVATTLGARAAADVAGVTTRGDLLFLTARWGIPPAHGPALRFLLDDGDARRRFRRDLPPSARERLLGDDRRGDADDEMDRDETARVDELWRAAVELVGATSPPPAPAPPKRVRVVELVRDAWDEDVDDAVHPPLIRTVAAFLDQGLALWSLPGREAGLYRAFIDGIDGATARGLGRFGAALAEIVDDDRRAGRDARRSLVVSLDALGVPPAEWSPFLVATALALRGFAGMIRQFEERPDRAPVRAVPATLVDFLAVRLLLERAALTELLRRRAPTLALATLGATLRAARPAPPPPSVDDRAWPLFHAAQLLGLDGGALRALSPAAVVALVTALDVDDGLVRRAVLHLAYERHLQARVCDALVDAHPLPSPERPRFAVWTCVDEREESLRRHLEDLAPDVETFGIAGFFGVAMYFQGERDARPRPLAPIVITPRHLVVRAPSSTARPLSRVAEAVRGRRAELVHVGSRGLVRGALVSALGALALLPLVVAAITRRLGGDPRRAARSRFAPSPDRLLVRREPSTPVDGIARGYTVAEMADIVGRAIVDVGAETRALPPVVLVVGHASASLNNPHRSAYDCGACGGGPGGANARAFAAMANDAEVREALAARGVAVTDATWFVGAEHNTAADVVTPFDLDLVPLGHRAVVDDCLATLEEAATRNARERARRFAHVPRERTRIHAAVAARTRDLAEPRPEYNHATNAVCVVGRRRRTRGLFLDRRAFLVSYDPTVDDEDGTILARTLGAVVPVVAGINLEYFFGAIDNARYGAGTKLPHNVCGLVGVVDGAQSDLRTGLWSQTVEIHEPVRLTLVVEAPTARLSRVLAAVPDVARLVGQRWLTLAALDPDAPALAMVGPDGAVPYVPEGPAPRRSSSEAAPWPSGPLPFAWTTPPRSGP